MTSFALIVKDKTQPGKRDAVRKVWEKHMAPAIAANPGHMAYGYCLDHTDPDSFSAFQQYASAEASREFLETGNYAACLKDVEPLLSGPPQVTALTRRGPKVADNPSRPNPLCRSAPRRR